MLYHTVAYSILHWKAIGSCNYYIYTMLCYMYEGMIIANLISLLLSGIGNDGTIKLSRTMHELSSAICLHCSERNDFDHHSSYFSDIL